MSNTESKLAAQRATPPISQDSKNIAILIWVGTIFLSFIPGLVGYLTKKDDAFIAGHSKEALNLSITVLIGQAASMISMIVLIGVLLIWVVLLWNLIQSVRGAIAASDGQPFSAPLTLRLIK